MTYTQFEIFNLFPSIPSPISDIPSSSISKAMVYPYLSSVSPI